MDNLKKLREEKGLSQSALAQASDVSLRMIQHYEQGAKDLSKASVTTVQALAIALDCSINKLMGWDDVLEK